MKFIEYYEDNFLYLTEAKIPSSEELYNSKFLRLANELKNNNVPSDAPLYKRLCIKAVDTFKTLSQIEYFLFWCKIDMINSAIDTIDFILFPEYVNIPEEDKRAKRLAEQETLKNSDILDKLYSERNKMLLKAKSKGLSSGFFNYLNDKLYVKMSQIREIAFDHFFSLGIPEIDNLNFFSGGFLVPAQLEAKLLQIEAEYYKKFEGYLLPSDLSKDEEDVVRFIINDEHFVWVHIPHKTCSSKEAGIMGHCGNNYSSRADDEVYSLRRIIKDKSKKVAYDPILTFIVNNDELRESKGSANDKPSVKYHPHIAELFKTGAITSINQKGTHKPENNFYYKDFSEEIRKDIEKTLDENDIEYDFTKAGYENDLKAGKKLIDEFNKKSENISLDISEDDSMINFYASSDVTSFLFTDDFIDEYGDEFLEEVSKKLGSGMEVEWSDYVNSDNNSIVIRLEIPKYYDTESGKSYSINGSADETLLEVIKDAIHTCDYYDSSITKYIGEVFDDWLKIKNKIFTTDSKETRNSFPLLAKFEDVFHNFSKYYSVSSKYVSFRYTMPVKVSSNVVYLKNITPENFNEAEKKISSVVKRIIDYYPVDLLGVSSDEIKPVSILKELIVKVDRGNRYYSDNVNITFKMNEEVYNLFEEYFTKESLQYLQNQISIIINNMFEQAE